MSIPPARSHHPRAGGAGALPHPVRRLPARSLLPRARQGAGAGGAEFLRSITNIGRSNWMLITAGSAVALALVLKRTHLGFRNAAGYGLIASTIGFVFVSVGGAGLIANLAKYILGRARPKLFDTTGPLDFHLFSFTPDYASFPSGPRHQHLRARHRARHAVAAWAGPALHGRGLDRREPRADRPALFHRRGRRGDARARPFPIWCGNDLRRGAGCSRRRQTAAIDCGESRTRNWLGWPRPRATLPQTSRLLRNRQPEFVGNRGEVNWQRLRPRCKQN